MVVNWWKRSPSQALHLPRRAARAARRPALGFKPRVEALEDRCLLSADVILEWNDVMLKAEANDYSLTSPEEPGPVMTARAFAMVSAAMYDAYNSIEHIGSSYLVTAPRATGADSDAAVAQAAHDTLVALFPSQRALFDAALTETLDRVPDDTREGRGRAVGAYVAGQVLAARADDGASAIGTPAYVPNGLPGFHAADPLHSTQVYYAPGAENVTPFAVDSLDQFEAPRLDDGTPAGRAAFLQSQEYTDAYNEVLALGGDGVTTPTARTAEQTEIGIIWAYDGRPGLGTPPRLYNQIARTVALQEGNTEAENVRLFALVNIAMADAALTAWNSKYDDAFWRPILGIRDGDDDGNAATVGDADWTPLGSPVSNPRPGETNFTPPFPAYTSGHATMGAALFQVLARFYGRDDISFTFTSDELNGVTRGSDGQVRPVVSRTFDSLTDAKLENAQSRIYLGVHWRFDADAGVRTGDQVADYVFDNFLQPRASQGHGGGHNRGGLIGDAGHQGDRAVESVAGPFRAPVNGVLAQASGVPGLSLSAPGNFRLQTSPRVEELAQSATTVGARAAVQIGHSADRTGQAEDSGQDLLARASDLVEELGGCPWSAVG
jgi:hypothetical protein